MNPLVSVVMAVKNYPDFLTTAISSILRQSHHELEFIIVDYGSTDGTTDIIREFTDPRLRLIEFPGLTFTQALNVGVAVANGEYIARQDADDFSRRTRLERQVEFMERNPSVDLLGTGFRTVSSNPRRTHDECFNLGHKLLSEMARYDCPIAHGTIMARASVFDTFDYDEKMECAQDYGLYLKIMHHSQFICHVMPDVLYIRFHTDKCVTQTRRRMQLWAVAYAKEKYGVGGARKHEKMRVHVNTYWRTKNRIKKHVAFIIVALYDYRFWLVEFEKSRARRGVE